MRKAHNFQNGEKNEHGSLFLTSTGRAPSGILPNVCSVEGTAVPPQARAVPTFWRFRCKNFPFLESVLDDYLQNKKQKEKRLNAWVASHEALF